MPTAVGINTKKGAQEGAFLFFLFLFFVLLTIVV